MAQRTRPFTLQGQRCVYCEDDARYGGQQLCSHLTLPMTLDAVESHDAAVRMFHDRDSAFPVTTTDTDLVRPMEWSLLESPSSSQAT